MSGIHAENINTNLETQPPLPGATSQEVSPSVEDEQIIIRSLGTFAVENNIQLPDEQWKLISTADKYNQFPDIKNATASIEDMLEHSVESKAPQNDVASLLKNLEQATGFLDDSLKKQEQYGLVDHRWIRRGDKFIENSLAAGRRTLELDVRTDKDGGFWVSHATGAKASYLPPRINELTTAEMQEKSVRFSLEEAFKEFAEYKDNHKLILELKTLGPDVQKFPEVVGHLKELIEKNKIEGSVAVASISPSILMEVHKAWPEMPLISNGCIVPGITYMATDKKEGQLTKAAEDLLPPDRKWRAFSINLPWIGKPFEVVIAAGEDTVTRADGEGTQMGYVLTQLPKDLTNVLKGQSGTEMGGIVSLSMVTMLAGALDLVPGAHNKANELRKGYVDAAHKLGLKTMATTWGQGLSKLGFHALSPQEQVKTFNSLGIDLIYTVAPEEFANSLPDLEKKS